MRTAPGAQLAGGAEVDGSRPRRAVDRQPSWWPAVALAAAVLAGLALWGKLDRGPSPDEQPAAAALGCDAAAWAAHAAAAGLAWDDRDGDCHDRSYEDDTLGTDPNDHRRPTVAEVGGALQPPAAQVSALVGGTCGGFSMTVAGIEERDGAELVTLRLAAPGAGISVPAEADLRFVHGPGDERPALGGPSTWGASFPLERGRTETRTVLAEPGWRRAVLPSSDPLGPQVQPCPVEAPR